MKNGLGQISAHLFSRSAIRLGGEYSEHSWVTSALTNRRTYTTCVPIFEVGHWPICVITSKPLTASLEFAHFSIPSNEKIGCEANTMSKLRGFNIHALGPDL